MSGRKREKNGRSVLVSGVVICIAAAIIGSLAIPGLAAEQTGDTVNVTVNAPAYVEERETFDVTIDVNDLVDFNSGQFDLHFDSSVVNVTGVVNGRLDGATIPVGMWDLVDSETIRVLLKLPGAEGVSGSGYLAKISFEAVGEQGDRSELDISNGLLWDKQAEEIPTEWIDDEVMVEIEHPFVTIKTDKSVYMCGENQTRTLTIENPTNESVPVKLGMGFHIYEIMDCPCSYGMDLFETALLLSANYTQNFDSIAALDLPDGKYAWSAYLKDATGVKISESEAKFSIVARAP
ncbi:MAG: hypothetical protein KAV25_01935 [Methanophagales archaeon]|nr:hypothetical protein [Methanophagales archaeon]